MARLNLRVMICVATLAVAANAWAKGETVKIVISGDGLSSPLEITNPDIVGQFNIWNGPGVTTVGLGGVPDSPAYLDPDRTAGRFIDWPLGIARDLPAGMQRLEVAFSIGGRLTPINDEKYWFAYEIDAENRRGYVYLPRWQGSYIRHGVEGNWFYASERWDELMMPAVSEASESTPNSSGQGRFGCVFGTGLITADGVIELYRVDEHGNSNLSYSFNPTDRTYGAIKEHLGEVVPGEETAVSCWPPRL